MRALAGTVLVLSTLCGCGGSTTTSGGSGGDTASGGSGGAGPLTLAVRRVFLGDTDENLNPDPNAWKELGVNVDGLLSTQTDAAHCKLQAGASKTSVQGDGNGGIDNSWGKNVALVLASLAESPTAKANDDIESGGSTLLIHVPSLGSGPNQTDLSAATYMAAPSAMPAWNGNDPRWASFESVGSGDLKQPLTAFPGSALENGVFSAAPPTTLLLPLGGGGLLLGHLRVHQARLFGTLNGSGSTAKVTGGIIAGVLATDDLVAELKAVAGSIDPTLCEGATFESVAQQIRAASDIMQDGTNGDPSKTCDGISFGIGFDAVAVRLNGVAPKAPPLWDPCAK